MLWEWISDALVTLPGCNEELFQRLLIEKRLRFSNRELHIDIVDGSNARLVCAALNTRKNLFLVLPDNSVYRPAFLCAIAVVQTWLDIRYLFRRSSLHGQTILYFGSTVGIREQLRNISISNVNLAEAFRQQDLGRRNITPLSGSRSTTKQFSVGLPKIVTIYAPADPVEIIKKYKPEWIGVDCSDTTRLSWLESLLQYAKQRNITVIGWGNNPLSECVTHFARYGLIFCWPMQLISEVSSTHRHKEDLKSVLHPLATTQYRPIIMKGSSVDALESVLRKAGHLLIQATQYISGRLDKDAIRIHWRYLRSLEMLSVPFSFYEAEVGKYWGIQTFSKLQKACQSFRDACHHDYREVAHFLEEANICFEAALEDIQKNGEPLWDALTNICIETPPSGQARFIIFTSQARKQLFLFALLARHNITESDLSTINIWVASLSELHYKIHKQASALHNQREESPFALPQMLSPYPLLVGLPSPSLTPKLLPVLLNRYVDVLIYRYQNASLMRRVSEWRQALKGNISQMASVISQLSGINEPAVPDEKDFQSDVAEPIGIEIKSGLNIRIPRNELLWQPLDPIEEVARLLAADEEMIEDDIAIVEHTLRLGEVSLEEEVWCENAIEVLFDQSWQAIFAPDETINVIITGSSGQHLDNRYVRSLQPRDRIVAIPGQRRQSLYDLLISRVHKHPSIELHLAFIRRWQEDFVAAYQQWRQHGVRNLDELLKLMREKGSDLTSPFTLRQWLWGQTLCPDDAKDLLRLAEILSMEFVGQYYRKIHFGANVLRGLHRSLSKRLNRWLKQEIEGLAVGGEDDIINAELGLTFEDFRNSLLILQVGTVRTITGPFLYSSLGRLEKQSNDE